MKNGGELIDWLTIFREQFPIESESMNIMAEYEALLIVISDMIDENPEDVKVMGEIKTLIASFRKDDK